MMPMVTSNQCWRLHRAGAALLKKKEIGNSFFSLPKNEGALAMEGWVAVTEAAGNGEDSLPKAPRVLF